MKPRTIHIFFGTLILALALLACNLPSGDNPAPTPPPPVAQDPAPTAALSATNEGACAEVSLSPRPSGLINTVTLAEGTSGENRDPVSPTTTFGTAATFHAVVALVEAPTNTAIKAVWFAADTGGVAECNTQIDVYELTSDGTRNIDFSLTPESTWPVGTYRVEIYTNNVLDQVVIFLVK